MSAAVAPRPITSGTLERTPLSHLFVFLHEKQLSGTLEVTSGDETAFVAVVGGHITKVQTSRPVAYLGALLYEQGVIDTEELNASLAQMAIQRKLHGEVLVERKAITRAVLDGGLREQLLRKLTYVLGLPKSATFTFHHELDKLASYGGAGPDIDPLPAIWRSVREAPPWEQVSSIAERIGTHRVRLRPGAAVSRFDFFPEELVVVDELSRRAMSLADIAAFNAFGDKRALVLAYGLLLAKQIELLTRAEDGEESGLRESISFRAPPATSGVVRAAPFSNAPGVLGSPPSTGRYAVADTYARSSGKIEVAQPTSSERFSSAVPTQRSVTRPGASSVAPESTALGSIAPSRTPSRPGGSVPSSEAAEPQRGASRADSAPDLDESMSPNQSYVRRSSAPKFAAVTTDAASASSAPSAAPAASAPPMSYAPSEPMRSMPAAAPLSTPSIRAARAFSSASMPAATPARGTPSSPSFSAAPPVVPTSSPSMAAAKPIQDDLVGLPVKTPYEGAKLCLSRGDVARAERLCRRADVEARDRPEVLAMLAWIEALRPENQGVDATRRRIHVLDKAIGKDDRLELAYFWRGQLHKRLENHGAALRDFRTVLDINSQNLDAVREVRLYEMRISRHSITVGGMTPARGIRRVTPTGTAGVKKG